MRRNPARLNLRQRPRPILDKLADPERGFPVLRKLIETVGPILLTYLSAQIPIWLSEFVNHDEPPTDEEPQAAP